MSEESAKRPAISVRGNLVGLGVWVPEHLDLWMNAINDPEFGIYSDGGFALPVREKEAEIFEGANKNGGASFAVYALPEEKFIGTAGLFNINATRRTGTFGIGIIDKTYWGRRYGTEATRLVIDYGFRFMNLHNIMLDTSSFNERAIRAYEKAGFKIIGRRRQSNILAGRLYDTVYMDCLSTEFESPKPGWFSLE